MLERLAKAGVDSVWYGYLMGEGQTGTVFHGELGSGKTGTGKRVAVKESRLKPPRDVAWSTTPAERLLGEIAVLQVWLTY